MDEEEAIFVIGKRLSAVRNSGEDLSEERIQVGESWILPDELADEYDKHYPPPPRRHKKVTDRVFEYSMVPSRDCRGELMGLYINHEGRKIQVLEKTEILPCNHHGDVSEIIRTSKCNRYDVITGRHFTFAVDKVEESLSVLRARYRIDDTTFCDETPIIGREQEYLESVDGIIGCTNFPFIPFPRFWNVWNGYVALRKSQITELRTEQVGDGDAE
jgi:hypothetical protein